MDMYMYSSPPGSPLPGLVEASSDEALHSSDPIRCPMGCTGKGICRGGACYCEPGWTGVACQMPISASAFQVVQ